MLHQTLIAILIAYFIGSISSAIIVCRLMGLPDPRTQGSQNPGATNVLRIGGKWAAAITLLGDALKGFIPVSLAMMLGFNTTTLAFIAFAAFLGHLFPIFFRFEGGKGVATLLGILIALAWPVAICWGMTWLVFVLAFRYVSLGSLIASLSTPFYFWFLTHEMSYVGISSLMALILLYRHRSNLAKLCQGKENKLGASKK